MMLSRKAKLATGVLIGATAVILVFSIWLVLGLVVQPEQNLLLSLSVSPQYYIAIKARLGLLILGPLLLLSYAFNDKYRNLSRHDESETEGGILNSKHLTFLLLFTHGISIAFIIYYYIYGHASIIDRWLFGANIVLGMSSFFLFWPILLLITSLSLYYLIIKEPWMPFVQTFIVKAGGLSPSTKLSRKQIIGIIILFAFIRLLEIGIAYLLLEIFISSDFPINATPMLIATVAMISIPCLKLVLWFRSKSRDNTIFVL